MINSVLYNGHELTEFILVDEVKGRELLAVENITTENPGRGGVHFQGKRIPERNITLSFYLLPNSTEERKSLIDDMNRILDVDEPKPLIFSDQPNRTFYAVPSGEATWDKIAHGGKVEVTFLCPDPAAFGLSETTELLPGTNVVYNRGNANAYPVTRVTFNSPATYFGMVAPDERYMLLGTPETYDDERVKELELVLDDDMDDVSSWSTSGINLEYGINAGSMKSERSGGATYFTPDKYGDEDGETFDHWHGPAVRRDVPQVLSNFMIEVMIEMRTTDFDSGKENSTNRVDLTLFDINNSQIGRIVFREPLKKGNLTEAVIYAGSINNQEGLINTHGNKRYQYNKFFGTLRMRRTTFQRADENLWWGRVQAHNKADNSVLNDTVVDNQKWIESQLYTGDLAQIRLHISKMRETDPHDVCRIHKIRVWKVNNVAGEDQVPELFQPGDVLEIDHYKSKAFLNGELFLDFIDPGADYFHLEPGSTEILFETDDDDATIETTVRERWL